MAFAMCTRRHALRALSNANFPITDLVIHTVENSLYWANGKQFSTWQDAQCCLKNVSSIHNAAYQSHQSIINLRMFNKNITTSCTLFQWHRQIHHSSSIALSKSSTTTVNQQQPTKQQQQQQSQSHNDTKLTGGWTYEEVVNLPNGISFARLLSGPLIATWIIQGQWELAVPSLIVSGASDWLDGYFARKRKIVSVLGSYLDPLADKALVVSVVGALGYTGALPLPLVGVIVGKDVFLILGAFAARAKSLHWKWPGAKEFFRLTPVTNNSSCNSTVKTQTGANNNDNDATVTTTAAAAPAAPIVQPLFISKVNTALQLVLVGGCMTDAWLGWPGSDTVWILGAGTAGTTIWSCIAYVRAYMNGSIKMHT